VGLRPSFAPIARSVNHDFARRYSRGKNVTVTKPGNSAGLFLSPALLVALAASGPKKKPGLPGGGAGGRASLILRTLSTHSLSTPDRHCHFSHFNKYRLLDEDFEFPDLLGAAYEYLISEFADSAGKKAGEFYTPRGVVQLMVRILDPQGGTSLYDPTCGSGGMLNQGNEHALQHGGPRLRLYGQEDNGAVWAICRMNLLLHGIPDADIRNGATLLEPKHIEDGRLMRFDRVIANPPRASATRRPGSCPARPWSHSARRFCRDPSIGGACNQLLPKMTPNTRM
jgi:hypothetical protein